MPRHQLATIHELARVALLSTLPGETLGRLAERMLRVELEPGEEIGGPDAEPGRFYVVLSGMLSSADGILRSGDTLGPAPPATRGRALMPSAVATCDGETYDLYIRPLRA